MGVLRKKKNKPPKQKNAKPNQQQTKPLYQGPFVAPLR